MAVDPTKIDLGLTEIWSSDYVQKNPNKAYKTTWATEYAQVAAYLDGGDEPADFMSFSKLGRGLCRIEYQRRLVAGSEPEPEPEPEPGTGTLYDQLSDFHPPWLDMLCLQRWKGTNWTPLDYSGTAWSDGSGIFEISTPHGPGFRFKQGMDVPRASGAGVQIATHFGGTSYGPRVLSGYVMLPQQTFPNYGDWNVLFEWVDGSHTIRNALGVDAIVAGGPKFYVTTYGGPNYSGHLNNKKVHSPAQIEFGHWYKFRWELNLTTAGDGYSRFFLDDVKLLDHTGATLSSDYGAKLWNQWGWYGGSSAAFNETQYASLRVEEL